MADAPGNLIGSDGREWTVEHGVLCVACPACAFTFDAAHTDNNAPRYSCPACGYDDDAPSGRTEGEARS